MDSTCNRYPVLPKKAINSYTNFKVAKQMIEHKIENCYTGLVWIFLE